MLQKLISRLLSFITEALSLEGASSGHRVQISCSRDLDQVLIKRSGAGCRIHTVTAKNNICTFSESVYSPWTTKEYSLRNIYYNVLNNVKRDLSNWAPLPKVWQMVERRWKTHLPPRMRFRTAVLLHLFAAERRGSPEEGFFLVEWNCRAEFSQVCWYTGDCKEKEQAAQVDSQVTKFGSTMRFCSLEGG